MHFPPNFVHRTKTPFVLLSHPPTTASGGGRSPWAPRPVAPRVPGGGVSTRPLSPGPALASPVGILPGSPASPPSGRSSLFRILT